MNRCAAAWASVARPVIGSPHRDVHRKFSFLGLFLYRRPMLAYFNPLWPNLIFGVA